MLVIPTVPPLGSLQHSEILLIMLAAALILPIFERKDFSFLVSSENEGPGRLERLAQGHVSGGSNPVSVYFQNSEQALFMPAALQAVH